MEIEQTVRKTRKLVGPEWLRLAVAGQKINAIAALRKASDFNGEKISLRHAKNIVDDVFNHINIVRKNID